MSMFDASNTGVIPTWSFPDRLRKAREHAGMEQADLAQLILKKRSTLSAWENGKHRPDELTVRAIAHYTGVNVDWLKTGQAPTSGDDGPGMQEGRQNGCKLYEFPVAVAA